MSLAHDFVSNDTDGENTIGATSNTSWADAKAQTTGTVGRDAGQETATSRRIDASNTGSTPLIIIDRYFMNHDTAGFPVGATSVSAVLRVYVEAIRDDAGATLHIVETSQAADDALVSGDFDNLTLVSIGSVALASLSVGAYFDITITDLTKLINGNISKIGLVMSDDLNDSAPGSSERNYVDIDGPTGPNPPTLRITYDPPILGQMIE